MRAIGANGYGRVGCRFDRFRRECYVEVVGRYPCRYPGNLVFCNIVGEGYQKAEPNNSQRETHLEAIVAKMGVEAGSDLWIETTS